MLEGFQGVLSRVNDEGGIGGAKFKFLVRDDQFDPSQSKRAIRELIAQKIWAFSGFTPALWLAAKEDLLAAGVLGFPFDVGAERQRTVRTSFAPYQNCLRAQAGTIVKALERGQKRIAFLELDIEAVHHCIDYSAQLVKKLGGEVVFRGKVAPGAPDCGPQVVGARSANPDAVLPFVDVLGTVKCVQAIRQQGWNVPIQVGMNISGDTAFIDALGNGAEGVTSVSPWAAMPGYPEWENSCGVARKYFPNHVASWYSSAGCTPALVLSKALKALGPTATRDQVVAYLESAKISTDGLTPDVVYKPGDHRPFDSVIPVEVKGRKWIKTGPAFVPARLSEDINDGE
ncbi:MAG: ABC transporter substrate-binding protein [Actinomycetota bacterium]